MKVVRVLAIILVVGLGAVSGREVLQAGGSRFTAIDDPKAELRTFPYGISPQGDIVGYYTDSSGTYGFLLRHR